jgi:hypothetical protein
MKLSANLMVSLTIYFNNFYGGESTFKQGYMSQ